MRSVASALLANEEDILAANERDLIKAEQTNLAGPLLKRLSLTPEKLRTLADGISRWVLQCWGTAPFFACL
jgi:gamma-glutamyl phosphate reductase